MMFSFENGTQNKLPDLLSKHAFHVTHISSLFSELYWFNTFFFFTFLNVIY